MRLGGGGRSLVRELLVFLLAGIALAWAALAAVSYVDAQHELDELLDAHLTQIAALLLAQPRLDEDTVDEDHVPQLHRYGRRVAFQLWEGGNTLRLHSLNAPDGRLSARDEGFDDVRLDGARWRVFSAWGPQRRYLVQVAERTEVRREIAGKIARNLLAPLVVALPLLGVLIWIGVRRAVRPLRLVNREVASRAPGNLRPLAIGNAPAEVLPLVTSLNRLFARVQASIDNERRFTADASHELRTPLAALRAQAQVARGSAGDAERRHALEQVIAACDRASHLVDQLLTLARLEPEELRGAREPCDLRDVLRHVLAELAPVGLDKGVELELHDGAPARVAGDARLLGILFRNVVDNAVRHAPPGSRVRADLVTSEADVRAIVTDEGPGVAASEREKLGRRFYRVVETGGTGTGLGLSIAMRIAQLHDAQIAFGDTGSGRGLAVTVIFPRSSA